MLDLSPFVLLLAEHCFIGTPPPPPENAARRRLLRRKLGGRQDPVHSRGIFVAVGKAGTGPDSLQGTERRLDSSGHGIFLPQ